MQYLPCSFHPLLIFYKHGWVVDSISLDTTSREAPSPISACCLFRLSHILCCHHSGFGIFSLGFCWQSIPASFSMYTLMPPSHYLSPDAAQFPELWFYPVVQAFQTLVCPGSPGGLIKAEIALRCGLQVCFPKSSQVLLLLLLLFLLLLLLGGGYTLITTIVVSVDSLSHWVYWVMLSF